ncbi:MAG: prepilin-type N-terminal cleavage/methylation domain-containing protein [Aliidongia sp.]
MKNDRGFTLIELLVAMTILGLISLSLLGGPALRRHGVAAQ